MAGAGGWSNNCLLIYHCIGRFYKILSGICIRNGRHHIVGNPGISAITPGGTPGIKNQKCSTHIIITHYNNRMPAVCIKRIPGSPASRRIIIHTEPAAHEYLVSNNPYNHRMTLLPRLFDSRCVPDKVVFPDFILPGFFCRTARRGFAVICSIRHCTKCRSSALCYQTKGSMNIGAPVNTAVDLVVYK